MTTATLETTMTAPLSYDPPGRGVWVLDTDHQSAPRGLLMQELFEPNYGTGFRDCFTRYGMPLETIEGRHVNGWFYFRVVPAGAPDTGKAPPPAAVLKVLARVVPELRRRRRTAEASMAQARWLADTRAWAGERAEWIARTDDLLSVDLAAMDDGALVAQVEAALTLSGAMIRRHFSLVGISVAVGRLIVAGQRWGFGPADIVPALRGNSPASSASRAPLLELAALAAEHQHVRTADDLRSLSPRATQLVDGYLSSFGWRPLATDVEAITLAEQPDRVVDLVRAQAVTPPNATHADAFDALRQRVPAADRAEFDHLVDEARECYAALDDNSGIVASTFGALRRTMIEAGRRAQERGALTRSDDVFNLTRSELLVLAAGGSPVSARSLDERREQRTRAESDLPPQVIGGVPVAPPDPSTFPGALGELAGAVGAYLDQKFTARPDAAPIAKAGSLTVDGHPSVVGVPVVAGAVVGRIVVSRDPADALERIEPGDILACPYTTAAHNSIFPMLGGVITQFGGPLGHTAVMAREFDIPAVVGTGSLPVHLDGQHGRLVASLR